MKNPFKIHRNREKYARYAAKCWREDISNGYQFADLALVYPESNEVTYPNRTFDRLAYLIDPPTEEQLDKFEDALYKIIYENFKKYPSGTCLYIAMTDMRIWRCIEH